jgi:nucleoside-diphosphate-sugar epimerase
MAPKERLALVIGAGGGIGGAVAHALIAAGWRVRALSRRPNEANQAHRWIGDVDWIQGDAMNERACAAAARGVHVIFHGANPPGYRNWRELAIPMLRNAIGAASASGARLIFPGNVYNYGPDAFPMIAETAPQNPLTRKGKVRVEMETMLEQASARGARSIVVRAGDFFGPHQPHAWLKDAMVKPGAPLKKIVYPGDPAAGHAWAYLPDLAAAIVRIAAIEASLPAFDRFNFGGHYFARGIGFAEAIARVAGNPALPIGPAPWPLLYLGAPFVTFFRELLEMRYLWQQDLQLDNRKLTALIGAEPHTPIEQALFRVLADLGCLTCDRSPATTAQPI